MASPPSRTRTATVSPPPPVETGHQADLWGRIMFTNNREPKDARFKDDTGTPVNWIHPSLAKRFKLDVEQLEDRDVRDFIDFQGKRYRAKQVVWFTMMGRGQKTYWDKYYIASERSNIDVILGEGFVNANGRARDNSDHDQIKTKEAQTDSVAKELAEKKKRKMQRDREAKSKGDASKSHKKER
ncbi:uncharacterized protein PG998_011579 [Apiospora kogelbergensis]|uniref:uncharacterized protein n=1 Tax=Apiospora kogelbergensis TaxID=1337665 RepID=UPI0031302065